MEGMKEFFNTLFKILLIITLGLTTLFSGYIAYEYWYYDFYGNFKTFNLTKNIRADVDERQDTAILKIYHSLGNNEADVLLEIKDLKYK